MEREKKKPQEMNFIHYVVMMKMRKGRGEGGRGKLDGRTRSSD